MLLLHDKPFAVLQAHFLFKQRSSHMYNDILLHTAEMQSEARNKAAAHINGLA